MTRRGCFKSLLLMKLIVILLTLLGMNYYNHKAERTSRKNERNPAGSGSVRVVNPGGKMVRTPESISYEVHLTPDISVAELEKEIAKIVENLNWEIKKGKKVVGSIEVTGAFFDEDAKSVVQEIIYGSDCGNRLKSSKLSAYWVAKVNSCNVYRALRDKLKPVLRSKMKLNSPVEAKEAQAEKVVVVRCTFMSY